MSFLRTSRLLSVAIFAAASAIFSYHSGASPLISDNFVRMSPAENVVAPFIASGGTPTTSAYSAFVEIIVSGTGYSFGLNENDAFYCSFSADGRCPAPGVVLDPQYYQMNIGMSGIPFAGGEANNIDQFITFIEGVGSVSPRTLPAYDAAEHRYHFILDLPVFAPSLLQFGVSDGIYSDNGGSFNIQMFAVVRSLVPEPGILLLVFLGLTVLVHKCKWGVKQGGKSRTDHSFWMK